MSLGNWSSASSSNSTLVGSLLKHIKSNATSITSLANPAAKATHLVQKAKITSEEFMLYCSSIVPEAVSIPIPQGRPEFWLKPELSCGKVFRLDQNGKKIRRWFGPSEQSLEIGQGGFQMPLEVFLQSSDFFASIETFLKYKLYEPECIFCDLRISMPAEDGYPSILAISLDIPATRKEFYKNRHSLSDRLLELTYYSIIRTEEIRERDRLANENRMMTETTQP